MYCHASAKVRSSSSGLTASEKNATYRLVGRLSHGGGKGAFGCLFHTSLPEMPDSGADARDAPAKGARATDSPQNGTHMEPNSRAGFRA